MVTALEAEAQLREELAELAADHLWPAVNDGRLSASIVYSLVAKLLDREARPEGAVGPSALAELASREFARRCASSAERRLTS